MTAKPSGKFDFDQTDQVRMAPESHPVEDDKFMVQDRNLNGLTKVQPGAVAAAGTVSAVGGSIRGQNAIQYYTTSGQSQAALAQMAQANPRDYRRWPAGHRQREDHDGWPARAGRPQSDVHGQFYLTG
jgi:hypothetical protein